MNEYVKNLSRLEFVITMACTGRCRHCSQGNHAGNSGHIDPDAAGRAVRDVCGQYHIQSMMAFGGEPLLWPEITCQIFRAGAECGVPHIDLITNGFFSRDRERIRAVANLLAGSGANRVLLSVDAFHQETIPLEPVTLFARSSPAATCSAILVSISRTPLPRRTPAFWAGIICVRTFSIFSTRTGRNNRVHAPPARHRIRRAAFLRETVKKDLKFWSYCGCQLPAMLI